MKNKLGIFKFFCLLTIIVLLTQNWTISEVKAVEKPIINCQKLTMYLNNNDQGDSYTSYYYLKVANATSRPKWSTSNSKIATVNKNGTVVAKNVGKAVITATMGKTKLSCNVNIKKEPSTSTLEKNVSVKEKVIDGYCRFIFTSSCSDYLDVTVFYNEYDSNGDKTKSSNKQVYLTGKGKTTIFSELNEDTQYVDVEKVVVELANNFQATNNNFSYMIQDVIKVNDIKASIGEIKPIDFFEGIEIPYSFENTTYFATGCYYQFVFYKNDKIIFVYSTHPYDKGVGAKTTETYYFQPWMYDRENGFKEGDTYSYDKCEIIPICGVRSFQSNE